MRPVRHRRPRNSKRATRRGLGAIAAGTAAVLVAGLTYVPGALADSTPAAKPTAMERAAESPAYDKVFADLPAEIDLEPLLEAVQRTVEGVGDAVEALERIAELILADVTGFAEGLPELLQELQDDPAGAVEVLQAALLAQQGDLLLAGLPAVLDLLAGLTAPSCYTLGALSAALPGETGVLPLNEELFGPLAPAVEQLDRGVSDAVYNLYVDLFAQVLGAGGTTGGLGLPTEVTGLLSVAQVLLSIFKVDVDTTYYEADGDQIVRSHPGLLNLPVLLDVDQRVGIDLCAVTSLDLGSINLTGTGGTPSALELSQTVGRVPLRNKALPVDLNAKALLGALQFGFSAKDTVAPTILDSTASLSLAAGAAGTYLPGAIDTELTQPGDALTQTLSLAGAVGNRIMVADPPKNYRSEVTLAASGSESVAGNGLQYTYTASEPAASSTYEQFAGTAIQGVKQTPAAKDLSYCTSAKGFCSNEPTPPAVDRAAYLNAQTQSMHVRASEPVRVQEDPIAEAACQALVFGFPVQIACAKADVTAQQLNIGSKVPAAASLAGSVWVDTDDTLATGTLATPLLTGHLSNLPAGFKAQDRLVTWTGLGSLPPATRSGTITCPQFTTTVISNSALGFGLGRYFCSAPVNTAAPTISISTPATGILVGKVLTRGNGTWTGVPGATIAFTYQWQRCTATDPIACVNIAPLGTGSTYTVTAADVGSRIRLVVTATNTDGAVAANSVPTAVVP